MADVVNELPEKEGIAVLKEDYEKFKKENPKASRKDQGLFFMAQMNKGVDRSEITKLLEEVDGSPHGSARTRITQCLDAAKKSDESQKSGTVVSENTVIDNGAGDDVNSDVTVEAASVFISDSYEQYLTPKDIRNLPLDCLKAAPSALNFFEDQKEEKIALLKESILKDGLWHPITVWQQKDGSYMILGGHTRVSIYNELYEDTKDEKYRTIPCKIYKYEDLDETDAKRIVILNNVAQRGEMAIKCRTRCYVELARLTKEKAQGDRININEEVGKLTGTSKKTVIVYRKLANLNDDLLNAYEERKMNRDAAEAVSELPSDLQQYLYSKGYHKQITKKNIAAIKAAESETALDEEFLTLSTATPYEYKITTDVERPDGFKTIAVHVAHKDLEVVKKVLLEAIKQADNVSEATKNIVSQILGEVRTTPELLTELRT